MMMSSDIFYGNFKIEAILSDLISLEPVQRLKNIHQGGAIFLVSPGVDHSRYEHSIGVMLLVRKLGGSLEEQVAALLHDVSHTAFSHVIDYVLQQKGEDYHEQIFEEVIANSTIPSILAKYGFSTSLLEDPSHTLLEMPLPDLCADRIDYMIRDLYHFGLITIVEIHTFINELGVQNGKIGLKSEKAASWITSKYRQLNDEYFRKPEHIFANTKFSELITLALEKGVIVLSDLRKDDPAVLSIIKSDDDLNSELEKIKGLDGFKSLSDSGSAKTFKERMLKPIVIAGT
ncbi:metal-dependent phosphohydrolase [Pedobacter sp. BAL39]|uniref:HD domain-containing protein n=1 Tax=Pedobacter sp. BAL39 TaxID=391596 RepID=UPI0001559558|nr:HD domain-containing protein [Pedobacter sp. BAL39]EDM35666.1 metal-dependent phosphohydrolase [Pedobacter sp. BAL39]